MSAILVDSNVILDVITEDPLWFEWSSQMLINYANQGELIAKRRRCNLPSRR
jgi:hypothetical protein